MTAANSRASSGRDASITLYPGGPLLVRGDIELLQPDGTPLPRRRRTVALCRCGHSALMPMCDGTHKLLKSAGRESGPARHAEAEQD